MEFDLLTLQKAQINREWKGVVEVGAMGAQALDEIRQNRFQVENLPIQRKTRKLTTPLECLLPMLACDYMTQQAK